MNSDAVFTALAYSLNMAPWPVYKLPNQSLHVTAGHVGFWDFIATCGPLRRYAGSLRNRLDAQDEPSLCNWGPSPNRKGVVL